MAEYVLTIIVNGVDQTAPAQAGMERLGVVGVAAGNILASAMQQAAGAVVGFVGSSITAAGDFQQNMNVLQAASGATAAQMQALGAEAMALGNDMTLPGASASDAATAMLELSKAGLTVSDTMDAAKGTLQLAAAAETDAATAAGVVAGALNAFGLQGAAASQIADQLAAGANASAASMTDLSQGFQAAGFAFNATGQHTDDLIASLAMLTNVGLTGSDAGTALKNAMMQLMAPTDAAAKTMKQYGINVRDAQGNMLPFRDIIGVLQTHLAGLSPAARDAALKTMLMGDGMKAMLPLLEAGVAGFDAMKLKVNEAGAAQAMAEAQMQGFNGALAGVGNAMETLQLVIGLALIPILTMLLNDAVAPAINGIMAFAQSIIGAVDPFAALIASIDTVIPGFALLVGFISDNAMPILIGLGTIIASVLIPALITVAATVISSAAAFLLLIAPLAAVGLAAALLYQAFATNFLGIADIIQPMVDAVMLGFGEGGIAGAFTALIAQLGIVGPQIGAWLLSVGDLILTEVLIWGEAFISWIAPYVPIVLAALDTFGAEVFNWIVAQAPLLYQQVLTWGAAFVDWITPYVALALATLSTFAASIWAWIVAEAPAFVAQLAAWGLAFVNWITPYIGPAIAALQGLIVGVLGWIGAQVGPLLGQLAAWGAQFIAWIGPMIGPAIAALGGLAASFFGWIAAQAAPILAQLQAWAVALVAWIVPATVQFLAAWPGMLSGFLDWIAAAVPPIISKLATWALAFIGWIAPMIPGFLAAIGGITLAILAFIVETAAVLVGKLAQWAVSFIAWIAPLIGKIPGALQGIQVSIGNWIASAAVSLAKSAADIGKNIVSGIISGVSSMGSALGDKLKSMAKSALDAAKSALGIHSPSSVMADQVGAPIGQGIAQGIQASTPKATAAMADMAGKLVGLVSSATGAFGQLANVGIISQGAVGRFMASMMTVVQMLDTINVATRGPMMASAMQITGGANKVLETITKGVDGFAKLSTMGAVPRSSMRQFADALMDVVTTLDEVNVATRGKMMASAMQITAGAEKVVGLVGAGAEAFTKLAGMGPVSVGSVRTFGAALGAAIEEIAIVAQQYSGSGLAFAQAFAESAGKIMAVIGPAVDGLNKLRTMGAPVPGSFQAFALYMAVAVNRVAEVSTMVDGAALAAAGRFADGAAKVIGILGSGVDGLAKLAKMGAPVPGMFQSFALQMVVLVARVAEAANLLSVLAVASAATFADGAGKVIAIVGSGVDAFVKLKAFGPISIAALDAFATAVGAMVLRFTWIAAGLNVEAVAAAAVFAEGAGKVVALIGSGVEGFIKLNDFQGVGQNAIGYFAQGIANIVTQIAMLASQFNVEAVAAAGVFADGTGKVLAIISNGVTGLKALGDLGPVSDAAIQYFATAINATMIRLAAVASQFSAESVAAAGAFADAAGKAVGILKNGVEGLLLVNTFTGTSVDAITRFGEGVRLAVAVMVQLASEFGTEATAAATAFANAAGQSTDFLKKGVEGFLKLADFKSVPQQSMDLFAQGVVALVNTIIGLSHILTTDTLLAANSFSNAIDTVITVVLSGLKALGDLGNQAAGIKAFTDSLVGQINILAQALASQARPAALNIGLAISYGIADGITSGAGAIQNAIFAAVNAALAAARAALGIASPSTVFKDQIGMQMSAGMAEGVLGGMGGVQDAVGQVSGGALSAGGGAGTTNNNQRSIIFEPGSIVIGGGGGGGNPYVQADAVVTEIQRRLGMQEA